MIVSQGVGTVIVRTVLTACNFSLILLAFSRILPELWGKQFRTDELGFLLQTTSFILT